MSDRPLFDASKFQGATCASSQRYAVALAETEDQIDSLLRFEREEQVRIVLVAITPEVDYVAKKRGLTYRIIEDFYSESELIERGIQNFERLRSFCDYFDGLVHEAFEGIPAARKVSSVARFYYLKRIFDGLLNRVVMIRGVLRNLKCDWVLSYDLPPWQPKHGLDWPVLGLTTRLTPHVAQSFGCHLIWLPRNVLYDLHMPKRSMKSYVLAVLRLLRLEGLARKVRALASRKDSKSGLTRDEKKEPWLISGNGWELDSIAECWQTTQPGRVVGVDEVVGKIAVTDKLKDRGERLWEQVRIDPGVRKFFIIDDVDTFPLVECTLRLYTLEDVVAAVAFAEKAPEMFERLRPAVLLTAGVSHDLARAACGGGVAVADSQHGGAYGYIEFPMAEYIDLCGADVFLAYGPGTSSYLERPSTVAGVKPDDQRAEPITVGSPTLDRLVTVQRQAKADNTLGRTIMYVNTNLGGDFRYHSYHMYADIAYWRFQRKIVLRCLQQADVRLVVKLYPLAKDPIHNPLINWLEDESSPNCEVTELPFTEVLDKADAYIIDTPSTALLQALTTEKPVIALVDSFYLRFDPRAAALLRKRAIVKESREEFLREITNFLSRPDWRLPKPVNDEFLMEYGTYLNDGRSTERSVEVLRELALNKYSVVRASKSGSDEMKLCKS
jgi:hypothetical protein